MIFDMKKEQNFASFFDNETKLFVAVESFNNFNFEIMIGTISKSIFQSSITAINDKELNEKIEKTVLKYKENKEFYTLN